MITHLRRRGRWLLGLLLGPALLLLGLDILFPLRLTTDYSPVLTAADGTVLHATLNRAQQWRMYAPLADISPVLRQAIIAKEDRWFRYHPGVNPLAVVRALGANLRGRRPRPLGASTITMQVARLLTPKERTVGHKLVEMLRALQLEWHLSKDEILELYLNRVPYGGNVEGVRAAALLYFRQPPDHLSLAQAVTLTVIPNDPAHLTPGPRDGLRLRQMRDRWLRRLARHGVGDARALADALLEPVPDRRYAVPRQAPHLARRLLRQFPGEPIVHSTLDPALQVRAEELTANYVRRLASLGIPQAAVVVVENRTRAVRAYVGSADFHNVATRGQVDGLMAVRSPGSTLKPLLYALAFDQPQGLTPASVVLDVPTDFGRGYRPVNFDQTWHGPLAVQQALALSLNVPAVRVLQEHVGLPRFLETLGRAGFQRIRKDQKKLGLSVILGGCGVRADELAGLYCALANGGEWGALRFANEESGMRNEELRPTHPSLIPHSSSLVPHSSSLISPEAAWLTTSVLSTLRRPDLPHEAETSRHLPRVAWKTGTSYGRRDAWSVGYNPRYTICVWVGDFSGRGNPALTGTDIGTPLLFDLFDVLDYRNAAGWFARPASLELRTICTESGLPPDTSCHATGTAWYRPGVSAARLCDHQRVVWTSADGRVSYCPACLPTDPARVGARPTLWPNLAPELAAWLAQEHLPVRTPPAHNPACAVVIANDEAVDRAPRILAPASQTEIAFDPEDPTAQVLLQCAPDPAVRRVYWYVNDRLLRAAGPNERVFCRPPRGWVKISCADDQGRNRNHWIRVL